MSERLACRVVKQPRGTERYRPTQRDDEDTLTQAIVTLASQYGRYGSSDHGVAQADRLASGKNGLEGEVVRHKVT